jgi:PIN domain nuclease of toxin-antitoxin system
LILLDTCVIIYDALAPEQLSRRATTELNRGRQSGKLFCSDISLWEIAMLMSKGRVKPGMAPRDFLADVVAANRLTVLPITPEIAFNACYNAEFLHGDPADRVIAATSMIHKASLLTCDTRLRDMKGLRTIW